MSNYLYLSITILIKYYASYMQADITINKQFQLNIYCIAKSFI